jgi:hypothetical protein
VHTAVWKEPVQGRRTVRRLNIDGDGQGDLIGHGGEHRAVMVYQIDSYRYWERYFGRKLPSYAYFGENLTIDGLSDNDNASATAIKSEEPFRNTSSRDLAMCACAISRDKRCGNTFVSHRQACLIWPLPSSFNLGCP